MISINIPGTEALERQRTRAWDPRAVMVVTLSLVFLCGAASGALLMDLRVHNRAPPRYSIRTQARLCILSVSRKN
jgi:hypothetical protein